jgi:hypothetical protein
LRPGCRLRAESKDVSGLPAAVDGQTGVANVDEPVVERAQKPGRLHRIDLLRPPKAIVVAPPPLLDREDPRHQLHEHIAAHQQRRRDAHTERDVVDLRAMDDLRPGAQQLDERSVRGLVVAAFRGKGRHRAALGEQAQHTLLKGPGALADEATEVEGAVDVAAAVVVGDEAALAAPVVEPFEQGSSCSQGSTSHASMMCCPAATAGK